jgi:ATP-dependent Clp protease adaptor protein ClpS
MMQTTPDTTTQREVSNEELTQSIPRYHVVLFDDNDHTYEYVVEMLTKLLGHSRSAAWHMAQEVDRQGRSIVYTTNKEQAEFKRSQIHSYGADWRLPRSKGSMSAAVEKAD